MAIKITEFGGTDWEDGMVLNAEDLIDTIKYNSVDFARGITPTASGSFTTAPSDLAHMTDGNPITGTNKWGNNSTQTGYVTIDLGEVKSIKRIFVSAIADTIDTLATVALEYSTNGADWSSIYYMNGYTINTVNNEYSFTSNTDVRYIRFSATGRTSPSYFAGWQIYDIRVYGD